MNRPLLWPLAATALVGALSLLIALSPGGGSQGVSAAAADSGAIDFAKIDADPDAPGIQPCRSVATQETFSIDIIVESIDAADSDNYASGGNVGFNFNTGDFASPNIDFEPGGIDDVDGFASVPLGTSEEKTAGKTHVAQGYFNPNASAPNITGTIVVARATLTAGTGTGIKTIGITKSTPLDGSFDFFMGASPTVQPTNVQSASIAIGTDCPANNPPSTTPQSDSTAPDSSETITLTATDPDGNCPLTFIITSEPSNGDLGEITDVSCSNGTATASVTYTPQGGFTGDDTFTYRVSDGTSESEEVSVSVLVSSEAPSQPSTEGGAPSDTDADTDTDTDTDTDADTDADTEETTGPSSAGQVPDDGDTNWILITIIAVAAAAAVATGFWWRLRRPGKPREG